MDAQGLIVILTLVSLTHGLSPLIAWSNRDVLRDLEANDGLDIITSALTDNEEYIDVVVVFGSEKLSFDDITKYGSVFSKESDGELGSLKSSLKLSKSQYWTGIEPISTEWMVRLAKGMGESAKIVNQDDLADSNNIQGVVLIDLKEYTDLKSQDDVLGDVMNTIEASGKSFVAIYAEQTTKESVQFRSKREVHVEEREVSAAPVANINRTDCQLGGAVGCNATENEAGPCILLCMGYDIVIFSEKINVSTRANKCDVMDIKAANDTTTFASNETVPAVEIKFNNCINYTNTELSFRFIFPNVTSTQWTMFIEATIQNITDEPVLLGRSNSSRLLHTPFFVPIGLNYACSSPSYNNFTTLTNNTDMTIQLEKIQVQPYGAYPNTDPSALFFGSTDNCVGYFSHSTWMGIVTSLVLILILYVATFCAFSLNSLDKFEDPRGKTISVEKLH